MFCARGIALDAEGENGAAAVGQILFRARVGHRDDVGMLLEVLDHRARIAAVAFDPQPERFEPLQQQPGVERRERRTHIAQQLDARL